MLDTTEFNREKKVKLSRENMAYGGSRTEFLANSGYTPLQSINILKGEQALGIDSIMIPTQTSHTLTNEDGGRKEKADDPTKSDKQSKNPEQ